MASSMASELYLPVSGRLGFISVGGVDSDHGGVALCFDVASHKCHLGGS